MKRINIKKVVIAIGGSRKPKLGSFAASNRLVMADNQDQESGDTFSDCQIGTPRMRMGYLAVIESIKRIERGVPISILLEDCGLTNVLTQLADLASSDFRTSGRGKKRAHHDLLEQIWVLTQHRSVSFAVVRKQKDKQIAKQLNQMVKAALKIAKNTK